MYINKKFENYSEDDDTISLVSDLYYTYLEDCKSFIDFKIFKRIKNQQIYIIQLIFSKKTIKDRKSDGKFYFKTNEIVDYWKNISDFILVLKSNGYESKIAFYQTNGVSLDIEIKKIKDEN